MFERNIRYAMYIISLVFLFILLIYFIAGASTGEFYKKNEELTRKNIQQCYGAVGCIRLAKQNSIPLDDDYKAEIKNKSEKIISSVRLSSLGSSDIAKLICISKELNIGKESGLFDELHKRYNKDAKLFDEKYKDDYSGLDKDQITALRLSSTDAVWMSFDSFGVKDGEYDILRMLSDGFNANTGKYDHNDIYNGTWNISTELENIFYYFLITDKLSYINYDPLWNVLGPDYKRNIFETNEKNTGTQTDSQTTTPGSSQSSFKEKSIANISGVYTDMKARLVLGANITPKYTPQQYYNTLDSEDAFLYNPSSSDSRYYEYTLFIDLSQPSDLKLAENKFFKDNLNKWLKNNYALNWTDSY